MTNDEKPADGLSASNAGLGEEALIILRELVDEVGLDPGDREKYYDIRKYAGHLPTCRKPRGDQACECGWSSVRCNLDVLFDELEGYDNRAAIDMARLLLKQVVPNVKLTGLPLHRKGKEQ